MKTITVQVAMLPDHIQRALRAATYSLPNIEIVAIEQYFVRAMQNGERSEMVSMDLVSGQFDIKYDQYSNVEFVTIGKKVAIAYGHTNGIHKSPMLTLYVRPENINHL